MFLRTHWLRNRPDGAVISCLRNRPDGTITFRLRNRPQIIFGPLDISMVEINMATYAGTSACLISIGDEFSSFVNLQEKIRDLEKEQNLSLWKRDSRTIASAVVKGLQRAVNSELVYYSGVGKMRTGEPRTGKMRIKMRTLLRTL